MYEYRDKILSLVKNCIMTENYSAIILCANMNTGKIVLNTLKESIYKFGIGCDVYIDSIVFQNGSRILVTTRYERIHGMRCKEILFDDQICLSEYLNLKATLCQSSDVKHNLFNLDY